MSTAVRSAWDMSARLSAASSSEPQPKPIEDWNEVRPRKSMSKFKKPDLLDALAPVQAHAVAVELAPDDDGVDVLEVRELGCAGQAVGEGEQALVFDLLGEPGRRRPGVQEYGAVRPDELLGLARDDVLLLNVSRRAVEQQVVRADDVLDRASPAVRADDAARLIERPQVGSDRHLRYIGEGLLELGEGHGAALGHELGDGFAALGHAAGHGVSRLCLSHDSASIMKLF